MGTVNDRTELVAPDRNCGESFDLLKRAEAVAAIRRGMKEFERGEGIPLDEAEKRVRKKHGFSR